MEGSKTIVEVAGKPVYASGMIYRKSRGALTYTSTPYSSSQDEKKPPPHAIFASLCFLPHQPRYRADNYAKLLVALCLSYSYSLMPNLPVQTASSLGKLGSAV